MEEARTLNHNWIGTEHILLGLIREGEGVAGVILKNLGVTANAVRFQILSLVESRGSLPSTSEAVPNPLADIQAKVKELGASIAAAKPPLGVKPRRIHSHERAMDLIDGCCRSIHAGQVPQEIWLFELRELIDDIANC